jgi:uncharacterized protein YggE
MRIPVKVIVIALIAAAAPSGWTQSSLLRDPRKTIMVNGDAMVYARPDKVVIRAGVSVTFEIK